MIDHDQYAANPASAAQLCRVWTAHVDALEWHLASNTWALVMLTVLLIAYPIARIVIPAIVHGIVPDVVRNVLNMI